MVIVVYVWLAYFNNLVVSLSQSPSVAISKNDEKDSFSFWGTIEVGLAAVYDFFSNIFGGAIGVFKTPHDYIINPN